MDLYEYTFNLTVIRGWSVIPVPVGTKRPIIKWTEYQERIAEVDELKEWFGGKTQDDISIGVVTGAISNLVVVDDDKGSDSPLGYKSDFMVKTGRGYHAYWQYEDGMRNIQDDGKFGGDVRAEGGFVIIPPSKHSSGASYKFLNAKAEIPKMPAKLREKIFSQYHKPVETKEKFNVSEGSRDNIIYQSALDFLKKGFDDKTTLEYLKAQNSTFKPPMPDHIIGVKLESAKKYIKTNGKDAPQPATPKTVSELTQDWLAMRNDEKNPTSTGFPTLDKIILGFIPRHLYVLTAPTNAGKSQLATNFAVNVASQNKKVAFIALEPDISIITALKACKANSSYSDAPIDLDLKNVDIYLQEQIPDLATLKATLNTHASKYALVIVDHIGYFIKSENTNQEQQNTLHELATLTKTANTSIMVIAHPRKTRGEHLDMKDIAGSMAFSQDATEVLVLNRDLKNPEDPHDKTYREDAYLSVQKKKVTTSTDLSYVRLRFSNKTVKVVETDKIDNTELIESLF